MCQVDGCYRYVSPSNSKACCVWHRELLRSEYMTNYNAKTKSFSDIFKWHEKVLEAIYNEYPEGEFIDVDIFLFLGEDFNWDISDGTIFKNNYPGKKIGKFGYQIFDNHTIKIYKL